MQQKKTRKTLRKANKNLQDEKLSYELFLIRKN